jgi:hypothetical protein
MVPIDWLPFHADISWAKAASIDGFYLQKRASLDVLYASKSIKSRKSIKLQHIIPLFVKNIIACVV